MSNLTFEQLREANRRRLELFTNARGEPAHAQKDGSDWSIAEWTNAICGEAGEAANIAKKMRRGDFGPKGSQGYSRAELELLEELADVIVYADLTAQQLGYPLAAGVRDKFNKTSRRVPCDITI